MPSDSTALTPSVIAGANTGIGATSTGVTTAAPHSTSKFVMTDGWYVAIACVTGVMVADTRAGPLVFGILTVALIYQLSLLLQGK